MQLGSFRIHIDSLTCLVCRCPYDMIFIRYMICYGRLVHFCCPALSVWPCERSVANRFYLFSVFLLSLPIISASLSNVQSQLWHEILYTYSPVCFTVRLSFGWTSSCLSVLCGFMAVFIPYLRNILSAVSDNPSTYGITTNPLLSCADLFLFLCLLSFSFSDIGRASLCRKSTLDSRSSSMHS